MTKPSLYSAWIEKGYSIFSEEGLAGIRIERIAKELNLNKSGFYHYFGDYESFLEELVKHHCAVADRFAAEMSKIKSIDPDLFQLIIYYQQPILAQMQMMRNRHHPLLNACYQKINAAAEPVLLPRWAEFIGTSDDLEFAGKYLEHARDMFYARITPDTLNETDLRSLFTEVQLLVQAMVEKSKSNNA